MAGVHLGQTGKFKKFLLPNAVLGNDFLNLELALGQSSRFVENHGLDCRKGIQEIGAFHQNPPAGGPADAAEIPQRDADHQRARAGDDQQHQGAIESR